jgi:hypothetical protein
MTLLLRQSLALKQPVAISAFATTTEGALLELEIVLAPISFGGTEPARFVGITQVLSDPAPLAGRPIAFQRLVASQFVREDEPLATYIPPSPPAPPAIRSLRTHPKAPHLRLVISREKPAVTQHCDMDESMRALLRRLEGVVVETPAIRTN